MLLPDVHGVHEREGPGRERRTLLPARLLLHALRNLSAPEESERSLRNWGDDGIIVEP